MAQPKRPRLSPEEKAAKRDTMTRRNHAIVCARKMGLSQQEVGAQFGLGRGRVHQLEHRYDRLRQHGKCFLHCAQTGYPNGCPPGADHEPYPTKEGGGPHG